MSGRGRGVNNAPAWMSRGGGGGDSYGRGPPPHRGDYRDGGPPRGGGDYRDGPRGGGYNDYNNNRGGPPPRGYYNRGRRGPLPPRRNNNNAGIVFRSYEEEREWVQERRRKRLERTSKWDVLPTPEQAAADAQAMQQTNFAATDFSGAAVNSGLPQQTRHARRLYLGNLPPNVTEQELHDFFSSTLQETSPTPITQDPILSVYINQERRFCFLEFKSVEMTTACLQLDGINIHGKGSIHIKRPNDYNPTMAPPVANVPQLNVAKLGIIQKTVPDGPNKIFVGGLHYHLQEQQVLELLQAFGTIKAFHLVSNDPSGQTSKGYCFVEYADPAQTQVAILGLQGMDLGGGKVLTARIAAAREDPTTMAAQQQQQGNNLVGGYNVEALIDAAMGIAPMPTAPGLLGGGTSMMVPQAPTLPGVATNPLAVANQALEAAFPNGSAKPTQATTRILVLSNMVTDDDLDTAENHAALVEEVRQECAKFGSLLSMQVPRPSDTNKYAPTAIRKVYLEYATPQDALAANRELEGRQFGAMVVETSYFSEDDYLKGNLY